MGQSVAGVITVAEASGISGAIRRRQIGPAWRYWVAMILFIAGGGIIGGSVSDTGSLVGIIIGAALYFLICRRMMTAFARQHFRQHFETVDFPFEAELTTEGFRYEAVGISSMIEYSAISEVFSAKGYLVIIAGLHPYVIPKRFFLNDYDEFVDSLKARLPTKAIFRT